MRKVLSFVLALALVLGSFSMVSAAPSGTVTVPEFSDIGEGTVTADAVSVLAALGVVAGYPDGTYKPEQTVTRAEMAKLIISELGLESSASGASTNFTDMSGYGWAAGYVGYAQSLGIIKGYGDGTFRPGNTVSYDEAITMIVRAIGYTEDVKEMNGTWPAVFTQKANVLDITDDVTLGGSAGANRGDVAIMLYNALTCTMGYADADGVFIAKKNKENHDIKVITNLGAEEQDYAVITKADADDAVVNIKKYIGAYAKTFTLTEGKDEDSIIAVGDVKSTFITGQFKYGDEELKATDGTVYKLDDVMKDVTGTSKEDFDEAVEFLNGDTVSDGETGFLDRKDNDTSQFFIDDNADGQVTLAVDLSGKTVKGVFSVMLWKIDAEAVVDDDDVADIEGNHSLLGKDFTEDDDDEIDLNSFELYGVKSLSNIEEGDVVYVYESSDDEIVRVDVGQGTASGEVTRIHKNNDEVTIDGKTYVFSTKKLAKVNGLSGELFAGDIETEDVVDLVLDAYGFAYDFDVSAGKADTYAIVLEKGGKSGRISDDNQLKLFTNTGDDIVFDVDDDVFDDDLPGYTDNGDWDTALTAGAFLKYGLDKDGVIDDVEDLNGDSNFYIWSPDSMDSDYEHDLTAKGYYDSYKIRHDAVVFTFDGTPGDALADREDDDNYDVVSMDSVLGTDDTVAAYVVDDDEIVAMLIYDYTATEGTYGVLTDKASNNSDAGYELEFFIDKKSVTYNTEIEPKDVELNADKTDGFVLWKIDLDASNEVSELINAWFDTKDTYATASAIIPDKAGLAGAADKATSYSSRVFTVNDANIDFNVSVDGKAKTANKVTLDSDVIVYYSDDGDFTVGSVSDLRNVVGKTVLFFDVVDEDGIYDIVLISEEGVHPDFEKADKNVK